MEMCDLIFSQGKGFCSTGKFSSLSELINNLLRNNITGDE